jgi:GxxExxY protein
VIDHSFLFLSKNTKREIQKHYKLFLLWFKEKAAGEIEIASSSAFGGLLAMTWNDNLSNLLDVNSWGDIIAAVCFTAENAEMTEKEKLNQITEAIIGAAVDVHRTLGPGLLESAYEACLVFELAEHGLKIEQQKPLPIVYHEVKLDCGYRLDLLVEKAVIVEVKSIDQIAPIHKAQLLSYLKLSGCKVGLLINFNVKVLKDGVVRMVNDFPDAPEGLRKELSIY